MNPCYIKNPTINCSPSCTFLKHRGHELHQSFVMCTLLVTKVMRPLWPLKGLLSSSMAILCSNLLFTCKSKLSLFSCILPSIFFLHPQVLIRFHEPLLVCSISSYSSSLYLVNKASLQVIALSSSAASVNLDDLINSMDAMVLISINIEFYSYENCRYLEMLPSYNFHYGLKQGINPALVLPLILSSWVLSFEPILI